MLRQPPASFLMMLKPLGLTSGATPGLGYRQQRRPRHRWCRGSLESGSATKPQVKLGSRGAGSRSLSLQAPCLWILVPPTLSRSMQRPWGQATSSVYFPRLALAVGVGQGGENGGEKVTTLGGATSACGHTRLAPQCPNWLRYFLY